MRDVQPIVIDNKPSAFAPTEIADFVALVRTGGEVIAHGLKDRVLVAKHIALLREGKCALGVAGLKRPTQNHRTEVAVNSGATLAVQEFPFELGWVFVVPRARGRRLSLPLCEAVLNAAEGKGVFATSHVTNTAMHRTLSKLGFTRTGKEWQSRQSQCSLALFVRNAD